MFKTSNCVIFKLPSKIKQIFVISDRFQFLSCLQTNVFINLDASLTWKKSPILNDDSFFPANLHFTSVWLPPSFIKRELRFSSQLTRWVCCRKSPPCVTFVFRLFHDLIAFKVKIDHHCLRVAKTLRCKQIIKASDEFCVLSRSVFCILLRRYLLFIDKKNYFWKTITVH